MKDRTNPRRSVSSLFDPAIVVPAIGESFRKLDPRTLSRNPVMFVVEIVTLLVTILYLRDLLTGVTGGENLKFTFQIIVWLWITLLFANFAEAVAEGRGKAQAATLRKARTDTRAKRLNRFERQERHEGRRRRGVRGRFANRGRGSGRGQ